MTSWPREEQRKRQARDEFERHLADVNDKIRKLREQDQKLSKLVDERRGQLLAEAQGKYASLEALQKAALGEGDEGVQKWLAKSGLQDSQRVSRRSLDVAEGWEKAVETVLGDYLQAVCVDSIESVTRANRQVQSRSGNDSARSSDVNSEFDNRR